MNAESRPIVESPSFKIFDAIVDYLAHHDLDLLDVYRLGFDAQPDQIAQMVYSQEFLNAHNLRVPPVPKE